jgi:two-component system, chemotaxis family, protein-glutamate methylesterase/glutaminase
MSDTTGAVPPGVVALGASAGGVEALQRALGGLPHGLPAALCVVLHIPATSRSVLAQIIARKTELTVSSAVHGEEIEAGHIYVAPPDHHLVVGGGRLLLDRGPKENGSRPAIDPLFRSVAESYGPRGVAVVLSGALADGASGAAFMAAAGGTVLVQDPADAVVPSMPEAALLAVPSARVVTAGDMGATIADVASELSVAKHHERKEALVAMDPSLPSALSRTRPEGPPSGMTCPECSGPLWEASDNGVTRFRCRVGHAYSEAVLVEAKGGEVEAALWGAVEALEEHAELLRKVASRISATGRDKTVAGLIARAETATARAEVLRGVLAAAETHLEAATGRA